MKNLRNTLGKLDALAKDKGATEAERASARDKADKIRIKLGEGPFDAEAWKKDVARGKKLVETLGSSQWELGELSASVSKSYGEARLQKFAKEIGSEFETLKRCRSTWRAWFAIENKKGASALFDSPAAIPISFGTANALNNHPNRWQVARQNPDMSRETARAMMKRKKKSSSLTFKQILTRINKLRDDKTLEESLRAIELTPEQDRNITAAILEVTTWLEGLLKSNNVVQLKSRR